MTDTTTSFLPWVRRGAATQIARVDDGSTTASRASVTATVNLSSSATATQSIELRGPEDVVGLDPRAVVRVWPQRDTFESEPNLFPLLEVAAADLPWRYSPFSASAHDRLRPWLALIVAADPTELLDATPASSSQPLPSYTVAASALPKSSEAWAWVHGHLIGAPAVGTTVQDDLGRLLREEPTRLVARFLCPRHLAPRTTYRALLVPVYERGRAAGLGLDPAATEFAWADGATSGVKLPVFYEWRFGTGDASDFESLARRIMPRSLSALSPPLGQRAMDVSAPGIGLPAASGSPMGLQGALAPTDATDTPWSPGDRATFVGALATLLNTPARLLATGDTDAIVTPPLYGRWYAAQDHFDDLSGPQWFRDLSSDPRLRVAAGLGTLVVQKHQRALLASAWARAPKLQTINFTLRAAQFARAAATAVYGRAFVPAATEQILQLSAGALSRVTTLGTTVRAAMRDGAVGADILDGSWRRLVRPRGPLGRRQARGMATFEAISARINRGAVAAAFPPHRPANAATVIRVGQLLAPGSPRGASMAAYAAIGRETPLAPMTLLVASLLNATGAPQYGTGAWLALRNHAQAGQPPTSTAQSVNVLKQIPPYNVFTPIEYSPNAPPPSSNGPGQHQTAFAKAAGVLFDGLGMRPPVAATPAPVDLAALAQSVLATLDPRSSVPAGALARVAVDASLDWAPSDPIEPLLVHPSYEQPMYEPLRDMGQEWLLPGLGNVPTDTVGLLKSNQAFIEAYMVGLNQEINRELLWNEYPADQRHTFFRQFWDTSGFAVAVGSPVDPDSLRDIQPIASWATTALGTHSARGAAAANPLVLLLRSELLRRYPNALIYAALFNPDPGHPEYIDAAEEHHPIFSGRMSPDITFIGFDLMLEDVRATDGTGRQWHFVIQEQPSEPKFGLDVTAGTSGTWDDLGWDSLTLDSPTSYIDLTRAPMGSFPTTPVWTSGAGTDAAQLARITFQKPVRFVVSAATLLGGL